MKKNMKKKEISKRAKPHPNSKNADSAELEKRIEDEHRKLAESLAKKKQPKKEKTEKKNPEKEKELSDRIKGRKEQKRQDEARIYNAFEEQGKRLDYSRLFSYLEGSAKAIDYGYSSHSAEAKELNSKEETLRMDTIRFYIEEGKIASIKNMNTDVFVSSEREAYKMWNAFNRGLAYVLFDLSMT